MHVFSKVYTSPAFSQQEAKKSDFPNVCSFWQQHTAFAQLLLLQVTGITAVWLEAGDSSRQTEQPVSQLAGWLTVR